MAYDINNKVVTAPVSVGDVANAIGESSLTIGVLCTSDKINPDSLIKPYECGRPNMEADLIAAGGDDGLYGYNIPMTSNSNARDLWGLVWSHNKPTTYAHLLMFDGYCHGASYDDYPFRIKVTKAGSAWVVEYECHNDITGVVNPGLMPTLKNYYPAFQVFAQGTPSTAPAMTPIYSWCGSNPIGQGRSGEYLYSMNMSAGQTYYIIPFLAQYKFTSFANNGSIQGNKYGLIYKDWKISEWAIAQGAIDVVKYRAWINAENESTYTIRATFGYVAYERLYIAPTYRVAYYNANGGLEYSDNNWLSVTSGFYVEVNQTYEFVKSISKINPKTGQVCPSGYWIRIYHKEQTSADGTYKEFYQDYIIP